MGGVSRRAGVHNNNDAKKSNMIRFLSHKSRGEVLRNNRLQPVSGFNSTGGGGGGETLAAAGRRTIPEKRFILPEGVLAGWCRSFG